MLEVLCRVFIGNPIGPAASWLNMLVQKDDEADMLGASGSHHG